MLIKEIFKSLNIAAGELKSEPSTNSAHKSASIWEEKTNKEFRPTDFFEQTTSKNTKPEKEKSIAKYSEEVIKKACNGEKFILLRNVPQKFAKEIEVPEGYKAEFIQNSDSSVRIEFVNQAKNDEDIWAGRLNLCFKNGMSADNIGPTSQMYFGNIMFGIAVPKNYQHSSQKLDNGLYIHSFTLIKANNKSVEDIMNSFNTSMLNGNSNSLSIRNLQKETLNGIKLPEGFKLISNENKYGYIDITILPDNNEKTFEAKLTYCFNNKQNAMKIGPSSKKSAYKSGEKPYSIPIPKGYFDNVTDAGNGKYYHNFIYSPDAETKNEKGKGKEKDNNSINFAKNNENNYKRIKLKNNRIKSRTRYGRGYGHSTGGSTACSNRNILGPGTRARQRYNRNKYR